MLNLIISRIICSGKCMSLKPGHVSKTLIVSYSLSSTHLCLIVQSKKFSHIEFVALILIYEMQDSQQLTEITLMVMYLIKLCVDFTEN